MSRLYVGNISSKANMGEVHDLFLECGKLKSFNIQDGSGYIEYETSQEAEEAIKKLHSKEICGQEIIVEPSRKISPYRMRGRNRIIQRRNHSRYHPRGRSSSPRHGIKRSRHEESNSRSPSRSKSKPRSRSRSDSRRNKHHHHKRHRSRHSRYSDSSGSD